MIATFSYALVMIFVYSVRKLHEYSSIDYTEEPVPLAQARDYMQAVIDAVERVR